MTVVFTVADMTCGHCEKTVRAALNEKLPGVPVTVDLAAHSVSVEGDSGVDADAAEAAIRDVGYTPVRRGL